MKPKNKLFLNKVPIRKNNTNPNQRFSSLFGI
jgi:hypothetical protein